MQETSEFDKQKNLFKKLNDSKYKYGRMDIYTKHTYFFPEDDKTTILNRNALKLYYNK